MNNQDGSIIAMCAFLIFGISCTETESEDLKLTNTMWQSDGNNGVLFYEFGESTFLFMYGSYESRDNPVIERITWRSGTYSLTANDITLQIEDGCQTSRIGQTDVLNYEYTLGHLIEIGERVSASYSKTTTIPSIPDDVLFGYIDFDNYAQWVTVESCLSPF